MYLNNEDLIIFIIISNINCLIKEKWDKKRKNLEYFIVYFFSIMICFTGWESWWSLGIIPPSDSYKDRFKLLFPYSEPTSPNMIHAIIQSYCDGFVITSVSVYLLDYFPTAFVKFNLYFILSFIFIAVLINIIILKFSFLTPLDPYCESLSWSPLAGNVSCLVKGEIICLSSQRMWIITPIICYSYILYLSKCKLHLRHVS